MFSTHDYVVDKKGKIGRVIGYTAKYDEPITYRVMWNNTLEGISDVKEGTVRKYEMPRAVDE